MKALLIREAIQHFERGGKPLRQMDVGMRGFDNLKRGDVLRCIKEAWVSEREDLIFYPPENKKSGYYWQVGNFGILKRDAFYQEGQLSVELIGMENSDRDIEETSDKIKKDPNYGKIFATVTGIESPRIWMEFFKVVNPRNLRESLAFDRGGSPLKKLDIGILTWDKLKPGDILQNKKSIYPVMSRLFFGQEGTDEIRAGKYWIITKIDQEKDYFNIEVIWAGIFRHAVNVGEKIKSPENFANPNIQGPRYSSNHSKEEWNDWFRIIQPKEYEDEYNAR